MIYWMPSYTDILLYLQYINHTPWFFKFRQYTPYFLYSKDFIVIFLGVVGNCIVTLLEFLFFCFIFYWFVGYLILSCIGLYSFDSWMVVQLPSINPHHHADWNLKNVSEDVVYMIVDTKAINVIRFHSNEVVVEIWFVICWQRFIHHRMWFW